MLQYMFIKNNSLYFPIYFYPWHWQYSWSTLVQSFKPPSNNNIRNTLNINSHISNKLTTWFPMNYSSMEQVLFEKLPTLNDHTQFSELPSFSNLTPPNHALNTLLKYAQDLDENLKTLYSKLVKIIIMAINHMMHINEIYPTQPY